MPSSAANRLAWTGPAPPKAKRTSFLGSWPRRMVALRIKSLICELTMRLMALAASVTLMPSGLAIFSEIASSAAALSRLIWPPRK